MTYETTGPTTGPEASTPDKPNKKPYSQKTPQEAHDDMKNIVARAVGTAAGAVEGFAETMRKNDVPEHAREAVEKLGEASREIGVAGKEQFQHLMSDVKEGGQKEPEEQQSLIGSHQSLSEDASSLRSSSPDPTPTGTSQSQPLSGTGSGAGTKRYGEDQPEDRRRQGYRYGTSR